MSWLRAPKRTSIIIMGVNARTLILLYQEFPQDFVEYLEGCEAQWLVVRAHAHGNKRCSSSWRSWR